MITQERLKELLHYDPETGVFTWKHTGRRKKAGTPAGWVGDRGYSHVQVDGRTYKAHQLAWLYVHGQRPVEIDHINRNKGDNRISNLRPVERCDNQRNRPAREDSTSGARGVYWRPATHTWRADISSGPRGNRQSKHLGTFDNLFDAVAARRSAENRYWTASSVSQ